MYEHEILAEYEEIVVMTENAPMLDMSGILVDTLHLTMDMLKEMIWEILVISFPIAIRILGVYLCWYIGISLIQYSAGLKQARNAAMGASLFDGADAGDKGSGFYAEDLDGNKTWCPFEDRQMSLDDSW